MSARRTSLALALVGGALLLSPAVSGADKFLVMLSPDELERAPSQRYARLSRDAALTELTSRGVSFDAVSADEASGVLAPVRLTSRLAGVHLRGMLTGAAARRSPFEIVDARLLLALSDFARVLAAHDVVEVTHFSMYRPARAPKPGVLPSAGQATSRHPAGLAIDVAALHKRDGSVLRVDRHFGGAIGGKTCGDGAALADTPEARELRRIVCDAADQRLFTYVLSPNYNAAHRDHLHLELKAGVRWMLVH